MIFCMSKERKNPFGIKSDGTMFSTRESHIACLTGRTMMMSFRHFRFFHMQNLQQRGGGSPIEKNGPNDDDGRGGDQQLVLRRIREFWQQNGQRHGNRTSQSSVPNDQLFSFRQWWIMAIAEEETNDEGKEDDGNCSSKNDEDDGQDDERCVPFDQSQGCKSDLKVDDHFHKGCQLF